MSDASLGKPFALDRRAPLREFRAELYVLIDAFGEAVETFGHELFGISQRQRHLTEVELDARKRPRVLQRLDEALAPETILADRFIV
jgi:hypothetical protein